MLTIKAIKEECFPKTYSRGNEIFREKAFDAEIYEERGDFGEETVISGRIHGSSGRGQYKASVICDGDDSIVDYACECPAYESYWGMCKHCVALALYYRETQAGYMDSMVSEAGKNTKISARKRLQPTSDRLKKVISGYAVRGKSFAAGGYFKQVELIPEFHEEYGRYFLQFKIGVRRKYVLKNICKLLDDIDKNAFAEYGRELRFVHDRSAFTDEALQWVDRMSDILHTQYSNINFASQIYSSNFREILLQNYGLERCLQAYLGGTICVDSQDYKVLDENPELSVSVRGAGNGVNLMMTPVGALYGVSERYLVKDKKIYRCSADFIQNIWPVLQALEAVPEPGYSFYPVSRKIYLSQEDYRAFCGHVLPVMEKYLAMDIKDVDFEEYKPQEAELNIYIDAEQGDLSVITVRGEAVYGSQTYDLFAEKNLEREYRDLEKERQLEDEVKKYFEFGEDMDRVDTGDAPGHSVTGYCRREADIYTLVQEGIDRIRQLASAFVDDRIRNIHLVKTPKVNIGVSIKNELLAVDVHVENMHMDEITGILSAYRRRKKYYRLKNGDFVSLENNGLSLVSELSDGMAVADEDLKKGTFTVPEYRAGYISEVLRDISEGMSVDRSTDFKKLVRDMKSYTDSDFEVPKTLQAKLRNYQKDGFRWLATLDAWGFGGILADDMGLGKTLQMIALLEMKRKTALIVCPASLVYNWESEIQRFAPEAEVTVITGGANERAAIIKEISAFGADVPDEHISPDAPAEAASDMSAEEISDTAVKVYPRAKIWVTSYDLLKRDLNLYKDLSFGTMVIDEAQYIKNAGTQVAKAVKKIQAGRRFALTGTPIENRLSDLWSIFDFVMPGYLYGYSKFKDNLEKPVVQNQDEVALKRLKMMVSPFILRRKKEDVLKDLPDKLEEVKYTKMTGEQRRLYDAQTAKIIKELAGQTDEDYNNSKLKYLAELTKLRMICCAPSLCYENYTGESSKTEMCLELLDNAIAGGHRVLLFSQFTQMLDILAKALDMRKTDYLYLSGKNTKEQRKRMVETFQKGDIPVFLISLKAGGTGLNLTAADMVIHYDPWWNVAAQNQATDRTHRIGQKNVVNVMSLVAKNTIEEKIIELQKKKAALAERVIEGRGMSGHTISREELLELLNR